MAIKGIDISHYQKGIDLAAAKEAGYEFVILKLGEYRKDECFDKFYADAVALGLKVGAYFFAHVTTNPAKAWSNCMTWLGGRKLDFPFVLDMEADLQLPGRKRANTTLYTQFAEYAKKDGYGCMVYCNEYFANNCIYVDEIKDPLWIAAYNRSKIPTINSGLKVDIWQYTSNAFSNDFYKAKLDRNYMYTSLEDICKLGELDYTRTPYKVGVAQPTIRKGTKGENARLLQKNLNQVLDCNLELDGKVGKLTVKEIRNFQELYNLVVDGIYGPKSYAAMQKALGGE